MFLPLACRRRQIKQMRTIRSVMMITAHTQAMIITSRSVSAGELGGETEKEKNSCY